VPDRNRLSKSAPKRKNLAAARKTAAAPAPGKSKAPVATPQLPPRLIELFRLSESEQRVVKQLLAAPAPLTLAALADALGLPLGEAILLCGPERTLRTRGLLDVEERALLGWPLPTDLLRPGRGLHLLCAGGAGKPGDEAALFAGYAPGTAYLPAPPPDAAWTKELTTDKRSSVLSDVVRDHLTKPQAVLLWLYGVGAEQLALLQQTVQERLQRPVVCVEGAALSGWPLERLYPVLQALRREADLRGAAVVVSQVARLGAAWRALCYPRPAGQTAPVILCSDEAQVPVGHPPHGAPGETALFAVTASLLRPPAAAVPGTAAAAVSDGKAAEDPAVLASREEARRKAALDAALAMGRPIPAELAEPRPAPPRPEPSRSAPPPAAPPRSASPPVEPPRPSAPSPPPQKEPPKETAPPSRPNNSRLAAALAKAGLPPPGSAEYQAPASASRPAPSPAEAPAPQAVPAAPVLAAKAELPAENPRTEPAAQTEAETASGNGSGEAEPPPLPLEDEAPLDEVIRVARTTPNTEQRLQLLRRLVGVRTPAVIQLFRMNLSSPNLAVREAAEAGMSSLFGVNWNRSRPIAPPIQPPRSDDGGRGPGGAF
jgi:hypothetical protein